jgi:hypothetical protein
MSPLDLPPDAPPQSEYDLESQPARPTSLSAHRVFPGGLNLRKRASGVDCRQLDPDARYVAEAQRANLASHDSSPQFERLVRVVNAGK